MPLPMEYHENVQRSIPATLALFGVLLLPLLLVSSSPAQINGVPPSVTSPGFGGRAINGTPPSVTSLGRNGYAPSNGVNFFPNFPSNSGHHHHHRSAQADAYYGYGYVYPVPVPYAVDASPTDEDDDDEYQGGPTIFDRRGSGAASYIPPVSAPPAHARTEHARTETEKDAPAEPSYSKPDPPEPPQIPTTLVFKDGHQLEIENYAIVSQTLYDLTPGHSRKIALSDLDLPATEKQNDDRGVTFQLPPSAQAN
jgi:hypothetical protein